MVLKRIAYSVGSLVYIGVRVVGTFDAWPVGAGDGKRGAGVQNGMAEGTGVGTGDGCRVMRFQGTGVLLSGTAVGSRDGEKLGRAVGAGVTSTVGGFVAYVGISVRGVGSVVATRSFGTHPPTQGRHGAGVCVVARA